MFDAPMTRRDALRLGLAGASSIALGGGLALGADVTGKPAAGKIGDFKISLAEWSLHTALQKKEITNLDFPRIAREEYGIEAVEFVNQFFKDKAHDLAYLKELLGACKNNGVTPVLIMVDLAKDQGDMSSADKATRDKAVENHKMWVDAAAALGCHAIRINTGSNYGPTKLDTIVESCSRLTEYGDQHKIHVICENHGGPSSDPDSLIALMKGVNKPGFGTLPDFGNFPKNKQGEYTIDVYDAIARLMPYAKGVSAKSYDFGSDGRETKLDFARIMKIVTDAGYKGYVGIEYEGKRLPEPAGIKATRDLLKGLKGATYNG